MLLTGFTFPDNIKAEYKTLSLSQQLMVDTIDGQILAAIEPGTSTIKILALRTARILSQPTVLPENIICFTASDASAIAMKQQLNFLVGDDSNRMQVSSVKAFCEKVVQDNNSKTETNQFLPISALETIQLLKKLIDAFPKSNPLLRFRSDVYHEIADLKTLFSLIKTRSYSIEFLHEQIDLLLAKSKAGNKQLTDLQNPPAEDEVEHLNKLRAAIDEFNNYENGLLNHKRYDEADCILLAIKAFEEDEQLHSTYREKFKYIQVDGNTLADRQAKKLLKILLAANQQPNIFAIHTKDEGSNLSTRLQALDNELRPGWIEITEDDANKQSLFNELLHLPIINSYQSINDELEGVTNKVAQLLQQNMEAHTIAIICPERELVEILEKYFNRNNISVCSKQSVDILKDPFVKKIIQLLSYISAEKEMPFSGDDLLFEILHFDFFKVPPIEIAQLSVEVNSKKYGANPTAIRKLLQERSNAPAKDLFDTGLDKDLKQMSGIIEQLIRFSATNTLQQLYEKTVEIALIQPYIEKSDNCILLKQLLNAFSDFLKNETARNPNLTLNELVAAIDTMQNEGLPISTNIEKGNPNSVQLINAIEAGVQQFEYLFIPGVNSVASEEKTWLDYICQLPDINFKEPNDQYSNNLLNAILKNKNAHLYISFSKNNKYGKAQDPATFITTILSNKFVQVNEIQSNPDKPVHFSLADKKRSLPKIAPLNDLFIKPIVNKFVMNVSALNSYLNCPLGFYYKNILRVPDGQNEALQFGSAIHYALEQLFKKMAAGFTAPAESIATAANKEQFPSAMEMIADFKLYLFNHRSNFTKEAFDRRIIYGEDVLENYYNQYINSWNKVVSIERNMRGIMVNGVPLKGKLDKLEFNGREVTIVDYKSGNVEKALTKTNPPNKDDPNGGDYWRQAVFYKLLVDNYAQKDWKVVRTEFDFIEPDITGEFHKVDIVITPADIETVKQQLTQAWHKISAYDFYTGCGKPTCHWCNFVMNNNLSVV
jgi:DNA helicase-2/ATP-dependent DNA helicase PcrA